ncbi:hypothetical protein [Sulfurospirillum sp. hDNRA2]|uniref:Uncharacterized protein n=2 Tax=Sulfurospirillum cavolei TaxID=366522 RepID=A0A2D3W529_9BACT|nr:hypothetical protein [Sulfurospirillum sp. DNRA8]MCP3652903.1 hypothetical protein [Sulfurospirillum sp. DNRA8]MCR1811755.1 hypothetical protein [Sulfurospirillum sp. DNRA8]DAB36472.1 MAG TPA: hypothetical protein CFH80_04675 [Sulfurospirillum cavolei]
MQIAVDITLPHILKLISQMNLNEIEEVKKTIVKKELYFKKFQKDDLGDLMGDFQKENYSDDFFKDLEDGLRKSSIYDAH